MLNPLLAFSQRLLPLLIAVVLLPAPGRAQAPAPRSYPEHRFGPRCAFDSVQEAVWRRNPAGRAEYQAFLRQVRESVARDAAPASQARALPDVTVPVVMHIIHTGGSNNISDAQVLDAVRVINLDFSKTNADTSLIAPLFVGRIANVGFRFRLARLDPSGHCTTGITRTYSTQTNIGDDAVKQVIVWDQSRYLNVWICTNANGAGGYSILPCQGGLSDGIVIRNAQFGSIGTSGGSNQASRSLTHEIGHYFGLSHTWGGTNTPGLPGNCGMDDGIADTPNTVGYTYNGGGGSCNTNFGTCTANGVRIVANVQNFMDYADCERMFTTGQRATMRASLALACRQTLVSAANLVATGTNDGYAGGPCAPVVAFRASATTICEGSSVAFTDYSYNADLTAPGTVYGWQFPGGSPATSSQHNPVVNYAQGGIYNVTLTISNANGSGTHTETQLVQVVGAGVGLVAPVDESFENPGFPYNFAVPDLRNWAQASSLQSSQARWARLPAISGGLVVPDGLACVAVRGATFPTGTTVDLISPNIDTRAYSAANPPVLLFDRAYLISPVGGPDLLKVQVSNNCGTSWTTAASFSQAALNTMGTQTGAGFIPDVLQDWQTQAVSLAPQFFGSSFQLRFELTTHYGNNTVYLDHVRLALPTAARAATFAAAGLRLFPNPATAETALELTLHQSTQVQVCLTDALGRVVREQPAQRLGGGAQRLALTTAGLPAGLYVVQVRLDGQLHTTKLEVR